MRLRVGIPAIVIASTLAALSAVTASAASVNVTPSSVPVGGTVTLSGDVLGPNGQPACQVPGTVTLVSGAFAGQGSFQHQDVETTAGADGKFRAQARILSGVAPGSYSITGRCGGGNLGVQATLVVTPAPPVTGTGPDRQADVAHPFTPIAILAAAALTVAALLAAGWFAHRRTA